MELVDLVVEDRSFTAMLQDCITQRIVWMTAFGQILFRCSSWDIELKLRFEDLRDSDMEGCIPSFQLQASGVPVLGLPVPPGRLDNEITYLLGSSLRTLLLFETAADEGRPTRTDPDKQRVLARIGEKGQ